MDYMYIDPNLLNTPLVICQSQSINHMYLAYSCNKLNIYFGRYLIPAICFIVDARYKEGVCVACGSGW